MSTGRLRDALMTSEPETESMRSGGISELEARAKMNELFPYSNDEKDGKAWFGAWEMQVTYDATKNLWQIAWHELKGGTTPGPLYKTRKTGRFVTALYHMVEQAKKVVAERENDQLVS
jgi:hypothetical protein